MKLFKEKLRLHSVKVKIFTAFMIFGGLMLLLLWIFQVQFLDQFYQMSKKHSVKRAAEQINEVLTTEYFKESIDEIARQNDLCVSILNEDYIELYTSNRRDPRCMIDKMKQEELEGLYEEALANQGSASQLITTDEKRTQWIFGLPQEGDEAQDSFQKGKGIQNITYASVLNVYDETSLIVLVNAEISPVNATVEAIRTQLIIITIILLILAMLLAYLSARKIAKPIITINDHAKQLAAGNYEVTFDGDGYEEIDELNQTLNYAAKELSKVQQYQRELIANMSHDLRTPLTMISGYGEMMRDIPGENTPENVQVIIDEANRLTGLVNDILDLSKLQAGVQTLAVTPCAITKMIMRLTERLQKMLEARDYHIKFEYDKECVIEGDEIKLNQVMYNLISNAVTYCGDDRTVIVKQEVVENGVRIAISDHGAGIPESELPYVWDRYYKSKQHHVRSTLGSGLGLSIVKNILDLHHAQYGVESEMGKGTTFWVKLHDTIDDKNLS